MSQIPLAEAQKRLGELIEEATHGASVIITQEDGSAVQLVPIASNQPHPEFGSARGKIKMAEDFDAPLEAFDEYAP